MDQRIPPLKARLSARRDAGVRDGLDDCPIRTVVSSFSNKWSPLVLQLLSEQAYRFGELRRLVPDISQRMITQTLRDLQRDGYVSRTVFPTKPPSVEYRITPLGQSLFDAYRALIDWADENHRAVRAARAAFDAGEEG